MSLFNTFFDALKITWKQKPMWKFTFFWLAPICFFTIFLFLPLAFSSIFFLEGTDPFLKEYGTLLFFLTFIGSLILIVVVFYGSMAVVQIGSNTITWLQQLEPDKAVEKKELRRKIASKLLPGTLLFIALVGFPLVLVSLSFIISIIFLTEVTNALSFFLYLFTLILFMPVMLITMLLYSILLPIFTYETDLTIGQKCKKCWTYVWGNLTRVVLYSLIVSAFVYVTYTVTYFIYYFFCMFLIVGFLVSALLLEVAVPLAIVVFFFTYCLLVISMVFYYVFYYLVMGIQQTAFTLLYCRLQNTAPLPEVKSIQQGIESPAIGRIPLES